MFQTFNNSGAYERSSEFVMNEKDKFDWAGNNFECWQSSAEGLLISGKILEQTVKQNENADPQNGWRLGMYSLSSKFLLFGYSLECFFKCVWLLRDKKNKLGEISPSFP